MNGLHCLCGHIRSADVRLQKFSEVCCTKPLLQPQHRLYAACVRGIGQHRSVCIRRQSCVRAWPGLLEASAIRNHVLQQEHSIVSPEDDKPVQG